MKNKKTILVLSMLFICFLLPKAVFSHCQVPCGIYHDEMRIKMMEEHITTIEKAMNQIMSLSKADNPNHNQIVRWVFNKEKHAEELSNIVTYYFMAQRIKPAKTDDIPKYKTYKKRLELLHHILVFTMKAKQSTDPSLITILRSLLKKFEKSYFKNK
jgi:nickel superoxide dismutase